VDTEAQVSAIRALHVSRDFLHVVGYRPELGRGFLPNEHAPGGPTVAIISHALWRTRFGSSTDAVGRTIRMNDEPYEIVGVLPESFAFPYENEPIELIVPLALTVDPNDIAENWPTIARLRAGVTREQAQIELTSLFAPFRTAYPKQVSEQDRGMTLAAFNELYVNANVQRAMWILMGAVTLVLLIACSNVANLFLSRTLHRRTEIALRAALGASRARIRRLILTESALVALASGILGLLIQKWLADVLIALTPVEVPRMTMIGIDWRVVLFTFVVSLATSVLFGGIATWPAMRARLGEALKESPRTTSGRSRIRQGLLAAQSALSMVLLVGAALLVATLIGLLRVDAGFDPEGLVVARLPSKPGTYKTAQDIWEFQRRVMQQLEGSPAIATIAGASSLPLERGINTPISIAGRPDISGTVEWRAVTPGYFETLGIVLRAGRTFDATDLAGGSPVAIVNEAFARRYFPDGNAIGQRIEVGRFKGALIDRSRASSAVEIVGIAADIREISLRAEPRRTMYVPQAQAPTSLSNVMGTMPVFIAKRRSAGNVERVFAEIIRAVDPTMPAPQVFSFDVVIARSLARERFGAALLSLLAALALALTAFGIYGVLTYMIQQRRREIGIRMALGAMPKDVTRLVMLQGIAPMLAGVFIGLLSALALSRGISAFLWGVTPSDPPTLMIVATMLLGTAAAASWIPAREAAAVDPVKTLNCE
jgi:putative ABC transport system permease protein